MTAVNLITEIKEMLETHLKEDSIKNINTEGELRLPSVFICDLPLSDRNDYPFITIHAPDVTVDSDEIKYQINLTLGVLHNNTAVDQSAVFDILNLTERVVRILDQFQLPHNEFKKDGKIEIEYQINPRSAFNSLAGIAVNYKRVKSNF